MSMIVCLCGFVEHGGLQGLIEPQPWGAAGSHGRTRLGFGTGIQLLGQGLRKSVIGDRSGPCFFVGAAGQPIDPR